MEAKKGLWAGLQQASVEDRADLCNMSNQEMMILFEDEMKFMIVSNRKTALRANKERFGEKALLLSREQAIAMYGQYFYKSSAHRRDYGKCVVTAFMVTREIADYLNTKKNKSAYLTRLIELERMGIINVD